MANPQVSLKTGKVSWVDPTSNKDGSPLAAGEVSGYQVGFRSVSAAGSAVGAYPILGAPVASTAVSEAITAVMSSLVIDTYATAVRTVSVQNGVTVNSDWSAEYVFDGVIPPVIPNPPSGVTVG